LFLTDRGRVFNLKGYQIPELSRTSRGRAMVNLLDLGDGETVTSILTTENFDDGYLVLLTRHGIVKKTELSAYSRIRQSGLIACNLDEGDRLVRALLTTGDDELMVCTASGQSIRFNESQVRAMGRVARGVKAVRLKGDDRVVGMVVVDETATLLSVCEKGYGKRTVFSEYRVQGRGGSGIRNIRTSKRNGEVVAVLAVQEDEGLMLMSEKGMIVRTEAGQVSLIGRGTQGVRVMGLKEGDRVVACAPVAAGIGAEPVSPDGADNE
jgi:DNA gyrase subunit A